MGALQRSPLGRLLTEIFEDRRRRNANYSLRALARDIGLSHVSVWNVIRGSKTLSMRKTKEVALNLRLFDRELESLLTETRLHLEPQDEIREILRRQVQRIEARAAPAPMPLDAFPGIDLFTVFLILETLELYRKEGASTSKLSTVTRVPPARLVPVLRALVKTGFVRKRKLNYHRVIDRCEALASQHHPQIKKVHLDGLDLAREAIARIPPGERYSATSLLSVPLHRAAELIDLCHRFIEDAHRLAETGEATSVYLATVHAFPLVRKEP